MSFESNWTKISKLLIRETYQHFSMKDALQSMLSEKKQFKIADNGFASFKFKNIDSFSTLMSRMKMGNLKTRNDDSLGWRENFESIKINTMQYFLRTGLWSQCLHMNFVRRQSFNLIKFYRLIIICSTLQSWFEFCRKLRILKNISFKNLNKEAIKLMFIRTKMEQSNSMSDQLKR